MEDNKKEEKKEQEYKYDPALAARLQYEREAAEANKSFEESELDWLLMKIGIEEAHDYSGTYVSPSNEEREDKKRK